MALSAYHDDDAVDMDLVVDDDDNVVDYGEKDDGDDNDVADDDGDKDEDNDDDDDDEIPLEKPERIYHRGTLCSAGSRWTPPHDDSLCHHHQLHHLHHLHHHYLDLCLQKQGNRASP